MRLARTIETIKAGEFALRVVEPTALDRLQLTRRQMAAAERLQDLWFASGMAGVGCSRYEGSGALGFAGAPYERMAEPAEQCWRKYSRAVATLKPRESQEVRSVVLWDVECHDQTVLCRGLEKLADHFGLP